MFEKDLDQPGEEPESLEGVEGREPSQELDQSTHEPETTVEESLSYKTSEEIEKSIKEIHLERASPPETQVPLSEIDEDAFISPGEEEDKSKATPINIPGPTASGDEVTPITIPSPTASGEDATPITIPSPTASGEEATPINIPGPEDSGDEVTPITIPGPSERDEEATPINIPVEEDEEGDLD